MSVDVLESRHLFGKSKVQSWLVARLPIMRLSTYFTEGGAPFNGMARAWAHKKLIELTQNHQEERN